MSFRELVTADNLNVFLNKGEFAEARTVIYDDERYEDIPIITTGIKQRDRKAVPSDNAKGLYTVTTVMHCDITLLDGKQPEKDQRIKINDREGGGGFFSEYVIAASNCEMGMLRIELEAIDE